MNPITDLINSIRKDIYTDKHTDAHLNFFYSSMLHYAISLEIASCSYESKFISFEKLCKIIPKKLGSRSSTKNILDHGTEDGFFLKTSFVRDKRIKSYKLSEKYSLMITDWYLEIKVRFIN